MAEKNNLSQAMNFAFDCQELTSGGMDFFAAAKVATKKSFDNINIEDSKDDVMEFIDGSSATLEGHDWIIKD